MRQSAIKSSSCNRKCTRINRYILNAAQENVFPRRSSLHTILTVTEVIMKYFNYYSDSSDKALLGIFTDGRYYAASKECTTDDIVSGHICPSSITQTEELIPEKLRFAPSVTKPDKILCAGLNYRDHAEETGGKVPEKPVIFDKLTSCLAAAGEDIPTPANVRCLDYEAELVVVVGKAAYNISAEDAEDYIFGYSCGNDLSARDAQFLSNQWFLGKSLPGFSPLGPLLVTKDEVNAAHLQITCTLNGHTVQNSNTSNMIFSPAELLAFSSKYISLLPGDLIYTGTPAGVILGKAKGTRVWMKCGDVFSVEIDGLGKLENRFV